MSTVVDRGHYVLYIQPLSKGRIRLRIVLRIGAYDAFEDARICGIGLSAALTMVNQRADMRGGAAVEANVSQTLFYKSACFRRAAALAYALVSAEWKCGS